MLFVQCGQGGGLSKALSRCAGPSQGTGATAGSALVSMAWQLRDTGPRGVKAWERGQESPAGCSGLGLARIIAFALCLQLPGQLVPAGCGQEKVCAVAPGV